MEGTEHNPKSEFTVYGSRLADLLTAEFGSRIWTFFFLGVFA